MILVFSNGPLEDQSVLALVVELKNTALCRACLLLVLRLDLLELLTHFLLRGSSEGLPNLLLNS